jgi:hypothetical protein
MTETKSRAERAEEATLKVYCPSCKAPEGTKCHTPTGAERPSHLPRYHLADRCGLTPVV